MNISQLKYLIAVAEEDTFLDAAERMNISQSSLSKQIGSMERELSCSLLDRSHRKAVLTPAGTVMYEEAQKITADYDAALKRMHSAAKDQNEIIHLGSLPIQAQFDLTAKLAEFQTIYPKIRLYSSELEEEQLLKSLDNGSNDMIICRSSMMEHKNVNATLIGHDELIVIAAKNHPVLHKKGTSLKEVSAYRMILMNPYTSVYKEIIKEFQKNHLPADITGNARIETILNYVSLSDTISLLPRSSLSVFSHQGIGYCSLKPEIDLPVVLVSLKNRKITPAMKQLMEFLSI